MQQVSSSKNVEGCSIQRCYPFTYRLYDTMSQIMNVVRFYPPGGPEKLKYEAEPIPSPPWQKQVLIKVHSVGLIWPELYWPIYQSPAGDYVSHIPGHDFSGVVTAVGPGCEDSGLEVGSEVYGLTSRRNHEGALAEFA